MQAAARESSPRGSGMHGAASRRRAWEARADSVTGATKWQPREGSGRGETRVLAARRSRELPLTWRGPGEGAEDTPHRAAARGGWPPAGEPRLRRLSRGLACGDTGLAEEEAEEAGSRACHTCERG